MLLQNGELSSETSFLLMDNGSLILARQNGADALQLLSAQRQLYSEEKQLLFVQVVLALGGSLVTFGIVSLLPQYTSQANAVAFLMAVIDCSLIQYFLGGKKKSAAKIQELFDCNVLQLNWTAGQKPTPEVFIAAADRHPTAKKASLENWYLGRLAEVPFPVARIVCQMTSVSYDTAVRKQYAIFLSFALGILVLVSLLLGICCAMPIDKLLSSILLPFLPGISFIALQMKEHVQAISRLKSLREETDRVWSLCKEKQPEDEALTTESRQLQDKILENRSESATVFDVVYKVCRTKQELYGETLANHLIEDYKKTKGIM